MTIVNHLHQVKIANQYIAKAPREKLIKNGKRFVLTDNAGAGFQSPILALEAATSARTTKGTSPPAM